MKPLMKEYEWPVKVENNPWPTATNEQGPHSYNHMELNVANNMDELGSESIPRVSRADYSPAASYLNFNLVKPVVENHLIHPMLALLTYRTVK